MVHSAFYCFGSRLSVLSSIGFLRPPALVHCVSIPSRRSVPDPIASTDARPGSPDLYPLDKGITKSKTESEWMRPHPEKQSMPSWQK